MGVALADRAVSRGEFVVYKGDQPVLRTSCPKEAERIKTILGGWVREPRSGRRA